MSSKQSVVRTKLKRSASKKAKAILAIQNRWNKKVGNEQCDIESCQTSRPMPSDLTPGTFDQASTSSDSIPTIPVPRIVRPTNQEENEFKTRMLDLDSSLQTFETSMDQNDNNETLDAPDYKLIDIRCLQNLFANLLCPSCKQQSLQFKTSNRYGFAHTMEVECEECLHSVESPSSHKIEGSAALDVNRRMVKFFATTGQGFSSLEKFCMVMNMESMSNNSFDKHMSAISLHSKLAGQLNLEKARDRVRQFYENPENQPRPTSTSSDSSEYLDLSVSFDGTWHKRGFTSNYGVGIVIELYTGLVVDFCVMSKYCHTCAITKSELGEESPEFHFWMEGHKDNCSINYTGSSPAMEVHAVETLWKRSLDYGFRYTTILSDGDSKAFSHLQSLHIYDKEIVKEECVNHVAKRLGTGLRKVVKEGKAKKITLGGQKHGSLKNSTIVKLTKYYKNSILRNKDNVSQMKSDILATLHHCVSTDRTPRHIKCPKEEDSWCFYNRALAKGETPGPHEKHVKTPISELVLKHIFPVYLRLASKALLERCAMGLTQNANESLNSVIWSKCPKTRNASKRTVEAAVAEAVNEFNYGNSVCESSMETAKIKTGLKGKKIMLRRDRRRMKLAKYKMSKKFQAYRRKLRMINIYREEKLKKKEGLTYGAGEF